MRLSGPAYTVDETTGEGLGHFLLINGLGFINKHDGDIILYLIEKLALVADQPVPSII
jgi:hypothetical protein